MADDAGKCRFRWFHIVVLGEQSQARDMTMLSAIDKGIYVSASRFAILFAVTATALLLGAGSLADDYCYSLATPANWALAAEDLPVVIVLSPSGSRPGTTMRPPGQYLDGVWFTGADHPALGAGTAGQILEDLPTPG